MPSTLPDGLVVPDDCPAQPALAPPPPAPRAVFVLAGLALAVRGASALLDPVPPRDGIAIAETVRSLAGGSPEALAAAPHHPLAAILAAPLAAAGVDPVAALAAVAVVAGATAVFPLHAVARRIFGGPDEANAAALLYAVAPPLVRVGSTALSESLLLLLAFLALDAAMRALRHFRPARDAFLAGLFAGAAYLARPEGLALFPLALLAPLPRNGGRPARARAAGLLAAALGLALVAGPWLACRARAGGPVEPVAGKRLSVLLGSEPAADPGGAAPAERPGFLGAARETLGDLGEALHPALAVPVLLGLLFLRGLPRCGKVLGPLAMLAAAEALLLGGVFLLEWRYGYGGRRHAVPAAALLLPFAGSGLLRGAGILARAAGPRLSRDLVLAVCTLALGGGLLVGSLRQRDAAGAGARALGLRLRGEAALLGRPPRVGSFGEPRVAWYAGGRDVRLLGRFGVAPGRGEAEHLRRASGLRAFLAASAPCDFVVIEDGDPRVPAPIRDPLPGAPAAREGNLAAWRAAALLR